MPATQTYKQKILKEIEQVPIELCRNTRENQETIPNKSPIYLAIYLAGVLTFLLPHSIL